LAESWWPMLSRNFGPMSKRASSTSVIEIRPAEACRGRRRLSLPGLQAGVCFHRHSGFLPTIFGSAMCRAGILQYLTLSYYCCAILQKRTGSVLDTVILQRDTLPPWAVSWTAPRTTEEDLADGRR
jgi:hypothetical protein